MEINEFNDMTKEELLEELKRIRLEAYNQTMRSYEEEVAALSKELKEEFYNNAIHVATIIINELESSAMNYSNPLSCGLNLYSSTAIDFENMPSFEIASPAVVKKVLEVLVKSKVQPIRIKERISCSFYYDDLERILEEKGISCWISEGVLYAKPVEKLEQYSDDFEVEMDVKSRTLRMKYQEQTL